MKRMGMGMEPERRWQWRGGDIDLLKKPLLHQVVRRFWSIRVHLRFIQMGPQINADEHGLKQRVKGTTSPRSAAASASALSEPTPAPNWPSPASTADRFPPARFAH